MASKKDVYDWEIGKKPPQIGEHSLIKHFILKDYLFLYVKTLLANPQIPQLKISVVDGFAGGGKYSNQIGNANEIVDGSPFLILNAIQEAEAYIRTVRKKITPHDIIDADFYFIEKEKKYMEYLRYEITNSVFKSQLDTNILTCEGLFHKKIVDVVKRITQRNRAQRAIFILDQFSYKDVPMDTINWILNTVNHSEIILTFSFSSLVSFISGKKDHSTKATDNIQLTKHLDLNRIEELRESEFFQQAVQEQLAGAIFKASGAKHMTLFFVTPKKGRPYWLVHLSKTYRARDVMMSLHYKHANQFSHSLGEGIFQLGYQSKYKKDVYALELLDDFNFTDVAKNRSIETLSYELPKLIRDHNFAASFTDLMDHIGSFTPALESHMKEALQPAIDSKEIVVVSKDGVVREKATAIKSSDSIEVGKQRSLFDLF